MKRLLLIGALVIAVAFASAWIVAWISQGATWSFVEWRDFWTAFNNIVLLFTLVVLSYYTVETYYLRLAAMKGNSLALRPILVLTQGKDGFGAANRGTGPALNVSAYSWFESELRVTPLASVIAVIPAGESQDLPKGEQVGVEDFKSQHTHSRFLIDKMCTETSGVALVYTGIVGERFYSYYNSGESQEYAALLEYGELIR